MTWTLGQLEPNLTFGCFEIVKACHDHDHHPRILLNCYIHCSNIRLSFISIFYSQMELRMLQISKIRCICIRFFNANPVRCINSKDHYTVAVCKLG